MSSWNDYMLLFLLMVAITAVGLMIFNSKVTREKTFTQWETDFYEFCSQIDCTRTCPMISNVDPNFMKACRNMNNDPSLTIEECIQKCGKSCKRTVNNLADCAERYGEAYQAHIERLNQAYGDEDNS